MSGLADKVVIVTGSSGGLGSALVSQLLEEKAKVIGLWHSHEPGVADANFHSVRHDLSGGDSETLIAGIQKAYQKLSRPLYGFVHAAGLAHNKPILKTSVEEWDSQFQVHLNSARLLSAWVGRTLTSLQLCGHIIYISSYGAEHGAPGQSAYSASKAALHGLAKSVASELGPHRICVNTVAPGFLETNMTKSLSEELMEKYRSHHSLGKFIPPDQSARFIVNLLKSQNTSGQHFNIDSRGPLFL